MNLSVTDIEHHIQFTHYTTRLIITESVTSSDLDLDSLLKMNFPRATIVLIFKNVYQFTIRWTRLRFNRRSNKSKLNIL